MRVTTIDGGFRGRRAPQTRMVRGGVGSLTTRQQNDEADAFNARFDRFNRVYDTLLTRAGTGAIPVARAVVLEAQFTGIAAERNAHVARLASLGTPAELMEWRSTGDSIAERADALASQVATEIGFDEGVRPWQIAVTLVGGAVVFGGAAYLLSRLGRRGGKRRHR